MTITFLDNWLGFKTFFEIFVNTGPCADMGLEMSKRCYAWLQFHLISAKLYEDIGYCGREQAITFLSLSFKFFMAL